MKTRTFKGPHFIYEFEGDVKPTARKLPYVPAAWLTSNGQNTMVAVKVSLAKKDLSYVLERVISDFGKAPISQQFCLTFDVIDASGSLN